ncbi:MAG: hypothetical protein A2513_08025 [Sulfurimonas sp. RIFOXYD12_FULL_33_39]|uniref:hypothetical protein n=1 Tax=unclassified Sulfurimonas TaxID=2623549 RepID=UPI0008B5036F|nr:MULTISPECIES: hypothetical protein [unclassified Sulfurimonas]OHE10037.1 MAG: hypothetical protein A2513_08025 [Sulfurimonas sp. RIFOXYD12_FULL_33_39]OHE14742.1 MAG: hypothetical protein A2530_02455 [Sulfurimonas sp. RIFOXYD2_FULL_34_21]
MKFIFIIISFMIAVFAQDIQMQSRELSTKEMKKQNQEIVKLAANEMSKSVPKEIDKYTKLIAIEAQDTTLVYIYEINTAPKSDEIVKKEDRSRMQEAVIFGTCKNSQRFLEADISIRYIYKSRSTKAELFQFNINQEHCLKL